MWRLEIILSNFERFEKRYRVGDLPWDIGRPDFNLINFITTTNFQPGVAIDIGCGTGDNAIWLSKMGF